MKSSETLAFIIIYLSAALFYADPAIVGASLSSPWWTAFTCHFAHAGLFHLCINSLALFLLTSRLSVRASLLALAVATLAILPSVSAEPTVGLSGVVYAQIAIYTTYHRPSALPKVIIGLALLNGLALIVGSVNVAFHALAFVGGGITTTIIKIIQLWKRRKTSQHS